ncbi:MULTISPECIES: DUF6702 family protein [Flavobacterium]|uniref:Peptidase E n=1 Tax=Flavobacterium sedimenticola TaxID=3043286 RepID=A0ABT6XRS3_9FLAO|nr:DUF6702 family protein [Flavobacterium sedimenticola]MDI9257789.1 hypothetical protein [Flavobacterium sedimenticola]
MKRGITISILMVLFVGLSAAAIHQFYVAIYQIDFVPEKKRLEITARIFADDLNEALQSEYHKKTDLGTKDESVEDVALLQKYLSDKFKVFVNKEQKVFKYHSHEVESNVVICYLSVRDISKITSLSIENTVLIKQHPEQQNIIQYHNKGKKQNLLLTSSTTKGMLK